MMTCSHSGVAAAAASSHLLQPPQTLETCKCVPAKGKLQISKSAKGFSHKTCKVSRVSCDIEIHTGIKDLDRRWRVHVRGLENYPLMPTSPVKDSETETTSAPNTDVKAVQLQEECVGYTVEDNADAPNLLMQLEAMTWASLAKDSIILDLKERLRNSLEIAEAEQARNHHLETLLRISYEKNVALMTEIHEARSQISKLEEAEERLCVQLGDLEVESYYAERNYRDQIACLTSNLQGEEPLAIKDTENEVSPHPDDDNPLVRGELANSGDDEALARNPDAAVVEWTHSLPDSNQLESQLQYSESVIRKQAKMLRHLERSLSRKTIQSLRISPSWLHKKAVA